MRHWAWRSAGRLGLRARSIFLGPFDGDQQVIGQIRGLHRFPSLIANGTDSTKTTGGRPNCLARLRSQGED